VVRARRIAYAAGQGTGDEEQGGEPLDARERAPTEHGRVSRVERVKRKLDGVSGAA
jgi:hypothetical protein